MRKTNKKGNIVIGILSVIFIIFAVSIATSYLIEPLSEMSDEITADPMMSNQSKVIIQSSETHYVGFWDGVIVFSVILLWIFSVISAFFINDHPIFFIITIIMLIIVLYVCALIANEYEELTSEGTLLENQQYYPKTRFLMNHLVELAVLIGFTYTIAIYVKVKL